MLSNPLQWKRQLEGTLPKGPIPSNFGALTKLDIPELIGKFSKLQYLRRERMTMATMASSPIFFSKFRSCSSTSYNKRVLPQRVAAVASIPFQQPINVDYQTETERQEEEEEEEEEMEEGEEDDNYKNLREQMCRIYTSAPRDFTIIDRGRRNSMVIGRDGFEELYMFSPGSSHEYYGEYAYVCIGQSAVLNPIILGPKESWTGGQRLHNPNL